jgi:hypothetical protein
MDKNLLDFTEEEQKEETPEEPAEKAE